MAKSSADDEQLRRACEAAIEGTKQKVTMSIRVAKSRGIFGKTGKLSRGHEAKARVLAICTKEKVQRTKAFLRVLKYSNGGDLEATKIYKLKHLSKVEVLTTDPSGCTFMLGFDNMKVRKRAVAPAQWTMRNVDDRNRLLLCIINICKEILCRLPKVVGMDVVEMALWAKENKPTITKQHGTDENGPVAAEVIEEEDMKVTVERDMVCQAEEEDMEALLSTYVMEIGEAEAFSERLKRELQALEAANVHAILESEPVVDGVLQAMDSASNIVEDMDEWLGIFNVKLRHMRQDIESIETRNNKLELRSMNNKCLIEELDKLVERLRIPSEHAACIAGSEFDESHMHIHISSCEWLNSAVHDLEVPNLDSSYAKMKAVRERQQQLDKLKIMYVKRASESLGIFFSSFVDFMINDKSYFSQKGQLKKPDHAGIQNQCRTYAKLLQHLKSLDKNCLGTLQKAYCTSLNKLMRKEAASFANELRSSTKLPKTHFTWLEGSSSSSQNVDTTSVSESYKKIISVFIPLLLDECSFFAEFMCFDVPGVVPPGNAENYLGMLDIDEDDSKGSTSELETLQELLNILVDGIHEDLSTVVDWASKAYPLRCVSMYGITERYNPGREADAAGIIRMILDSLESRISMHFHRFVDDTCHQVEKHERKQSGVLSYILRFATFATRLEHYIQGESRELVDQAYLKVVTVMFVTLDKIAQSEPKYADIVLLENYAAFQNSLYDLANVIPTLAKFYHQASEEYEQQFEKLFAFARKVEDEMATVSAEEIQYQVGFSKSELRKAVKSGLSGVDKSINAMHKKLAKHLTSDELLPTLWDKLKKEFLAKYSNFQVIVTKVYPAEKIPPVIEMRDLLASM